MQFKPYKTKNSPHQLGHSPIRLTRNDIAEMLGITITNLRTLESRNKLKLSTSNPWIGFWNLVLYLEKNGLRPECIENQLDN